MKFSSAIILSLALGSVEAFSPNSSPAARRTVVKSAVDEAVSTKDASSDKTKDPLLIRAAKGEKVSALPFG